MPCALTLARSASLHGRLAIRRLSSGAAADAMANVPGLSAISGLLEAQGLVPRTMANRRGLHPLVVPLAVEDGGGDVLGLLYWPSAAGGLSLVRTRPGSLMVEPCGGIGQYARRAAAEADAAEAAGGSASLAIIQSAARVSAEAGDTPYAAGDLAASRVRLDQFLLLRVGPFPDVWARVASAQLAKGDETAAIIAAERASSTNPGWGCCLWRQSQLMDKLGRTEERRDLALAALEPPFWTLGAPVRDVIAAARLSHIEDVRALVREMEDKLREQQGGGARSGRELALLRALDAMDDVVRKDGSAGTWDDVRPAVAAAFDEAGMDAIARIAAPL